MSVRAPSASRQVNSAMRYADAAADTIVKDARFEELRGRIVALFGTERFTSHQIAEQLRGQMELQPTVSLDTASSIIRRVVKELVSEEVRTQVKSVLQGRAIKRRESEIGEKRDEWMRDNGLFVWNEDQEEFFLQLIQRQEMKRGEGDIVNHGKVATAMCGRFGEGTFDANRCRRHLEQLRRQGHVKHSSVQRTRGKQPASEVPETADAA